MNSNCFPINCPHSWMFQFQLHVKSLETTWLKDDMAHLNGAKKHSTAVAMYSDENLFLCPSACTRTRTHTPPVTQHPSRPEVCLVYSALNWAEPATRPAVKPLELTVLPKLKETSFQETEMGRKQCAQTLASAHMEEGAGIPQQSLEFWLVIFILSYITLKAVVRLR